MRPQYDFGHKFHITNPFCAVLRKGLRKILGVNQISKSGGIIFLTFANVFGLNVTDV